MILGLMKKCVAKTQYALVDDGKRCRGRLLVELEFDHMKVIRTKHFSPSSIRKGSQSLCWRGICLVSALSIVGGLGCGDSREVMYITPQHQSLGLVTTGDMAAAEFTFVNNTRADVSIVGVYPSCQCTNVEMSCDLIPSGGKATLRARADLTSQAGLQELSITILTNSDEFPEFRVSFSAIAPVRKERPCRYNLGTFHPSTKFKAEIPAVAVTSARINGITSSSREGMTFAFVQRVASAGGDKIEVSGTAPSRIGVFEELVEVHEVDGEAAENVRGTVSLTVYGKVESVWRVPKDIYAGHILNGAEHRLPQHVTSVPVSNGVADNPKQVRVFFSDDWLVGEVMKVSADEVVWELSVLPVQHEVCGPISASGTVEFVYADGRAEQHPFTVYAFLDAATSK